MIDYGDNQDLGAMSRSLFVSLGRHTPHVKTTRIEEWLLRGQRVVDGGLFFMTIVPTANKARYVDRALENPGARNTGKVFIDSLCIIDSCDNVVVQGDLQFEETIANRKPWSVLGEELMKIGPTARFIVNDRNTPHAKGLVSILVANLQRYNQPQKIPLAWSFALASDVIAGAFPILATKLHYNISLMHLSMFHPRATEANLTDETETKFLSETINRFPEIVPLGLCRHYDPVHCPPIGASVESAFSCSQFGEAFACFLKLVGIANPSVDAKDISNASDRMLWAHPNPDSDTADIIQFPPVPPSGSLSGGMIGLLADPLRKWIQRSPHATLGANCIICGNERYDTDDMVPTTPRAPRTSCSSRGSTTRANGSNGPAGSGGKPPRIMQHHRRRHHSRAASGSVFGFRSSSVRSVAGWFDAVPGHFLSDREVSNGSYGDRFSCLDDTVGALRCVMFSVVWVILRNRGYNVPFSMLKVWFLVLFDITQSREGEAFIPKLQNSVRNVIFGMVPWTLVFGSEISTAHSGPKTNNTLHPSEHALLDKDVVVSLHPTAKYYHYRRCVLWRNSLGTRKAAKQLGYSPCPRCCKISECSAIHASNPEEIREFGLPPISDRMDGMRENARSTHRRSQTMGPYLSSLSTKKTPKNSTHRSRRGCKNNAPSIHSRRTIIKRVSHKTTNHSEGDVSALLSNSQPAATATATATSAATTTMRSFSSAGSVGQRLFRSSPNPQSSEVKEDDATTRHAVLDHTRDNVSLSSCPGRSRNNTSTDAVYDHSTLRAETRARVVPRPPEKQSPKQRRVRPPQQPQEQTRVPPAFTPGRAPGGCEVSRSTDPGSPTGTFDHGAGFIPELDLHLQGPQAQPPMTLPNKAVYIPLGPASKTPKIAQRTAHPQASTVFSFMRGDKGPVATRLGRHDRADHSDGQVSQSCSKYPYVLPSHSDTNNAINDAHPRPNELVQRRKKSRNCESIRNTNRPEPMVNRNPPRRRNKRKWFKWPSCCSVD